ncbi:MAG: D-tyrosyl-tRNA(Tyr) deacylase [Chlamydiia bacterium]|nr:D-tyrosyl-tRNA(Tyr) deacylase [Chlamydiia bacterium]
MRLLLQRVKSASVSIDKKKVSEIGPGLLVFVGIHRDDTPESIERIVPKMVNLRIFGDEEGKINHSLLDVKGEVLIVSQFTLYGRCERGRRPDFLLSAPPEKAIPLYEKFIEKVKNQGIKVQTGQFGAVMDVELVNDGPFTIILE